MRKVDAMRLILLLCVLLFPADALAQGAVLVMNSAAASLSVVDVATMKETRRIPVLREPHHFTLTPDKRDLLVGDTVANELLILDPVTFELRRRVTMSDPYQLGFSPDAKYLVVPALARAQIDIYEPGSYKLIKRFNIKSMPSHLDFAPDSSAVYVTLQGTNKTVAIDLKRLEVLWTADVGKAPAGVLFHNGRVMVANMGQDDVTVLDPKDGRTIERIKAGRGAHTLFRSPDRKLIYVNSRIDSTSIAFDAATMKPVRTYSLPGGPDDLDFAPDGRIWYTLRFAHKLAVLDPKTGAVTTLDVGRSPHGIFLNPKGIAGK
jgi:YVTN family beta-propeller protein